MNGFARVLYGAALSGAASAQVLSCSAPQKPMLDVEFLLGRGKLDEAISAYERGVALKRHCESKLKEAQVKIEQITVGDNAIGTTGFGG